MTNFSPERIIDERLALEPLQAVGEISDSFEAGDAAPIALDSLARIVESRERYYMAIKRADAGLAAAEALFAGFKGRR